MVKATSLCGLGQTAYAAVELVDHQLARIVERLPRGEDCLCRAGCKVAPGFGGAGLHDHGMALR